MEPIVCSTVLLDIEGTVAPVAFVYDVMFPFVRKHVHPFLVSNWNVPSVQDAVQLVSKDVGHEDPESWLATGSSIINSTNDIESRASVVTRAVNDLMDRDAKVTGLKQLQGLIWKDGFTSGQLVAELFSDVLPVLQQWKSSGFDLFIYSSGSVGAQKLFFGHTTQGDLLGLFSGHFDTTTGNKKEASSYTSISEQIGVVPDEVCFVSDVIAELDAAASIGMRTVLRPAENTGTGNHTAISSFDEIRISKPG